MRTVNIISIIAIFVFIIAGGLSAQDTRSKSQVLRIKQLMTASEFNACGLEKLSSAELDRLDTWIQSYTVHVAEGLTRATSPKTEEQKLSPVPSTTKEQKIVPAATWHEIAHWQGSGTKNTETFHIPSREWRISWSTEPGEYGDMNFAIFVYKDNGSLVSLAANVIGEDKDSSFMRGSGDYYLTINTLQPYVVIAEAKY